MLFSDIIGHKEIIKALRISLAETKTGHAYLFAGPAGVGKKSLAKDFARGLLCPIHHGDCIDGCNSCQLFRYGTHPDFILVHPSGNSIKIEQLREIQRSVYFRPLVSPKKVFFFPEAEQLTEAAANSFLKILEEPPPGVVFLFTAIRVDNLLPTIRSRCQVYNLFPVPISEIELWLQRKGFSECEAAQRGMASQGLPGAALEHDKITNVQNPIHLAELWEQNLLQLFKLANDLEKRERREILGLLQDLAKQIRIELLLSVQTNSVEKLPRLLFFSQKITQVITMVESNVNFRLALEEIFLHAKVYANNV